MVIFAGGTFRKNIGKTFHVRGYFHDTTHISFIKTYWFYFRKGSYFREKEARKKPKIYARTNFHVNGIVWNKQKHVDIHVRQNRGIIIGITRIEPVGEPYREVCLSP